MSFLLNYLDGALDAVTGRYDGEEGEESLSEEGSVAADADVREDEEGVSVRVRNTDLEGSSATATPAPTPTAAAPAAPAAATSKKPELPPVVPTRLRPTSETTREAQNSRRDNDSATATAAAAAATAAAAAAATAAAAAASATTTSDGNSMPAGRPVPTNESVLQLPEESTAGAATLQRGPVLVEEGEVEGNGKGEGKGKGKGGEREVERDPNRNQQRRRKETLQLDRALEPEVAERQQVLLDKEERVVTVASDEEEEKERDRDTDTNTALGLERRRQEEEPRFAAEAAAAAAAAAATAAAAAAALEEEKQRERVRKRQEDARLAAQAAAAAAAAATAAALEQEQEEQCERQRREEERTREEEKQRSAAQEAAAAAAAAVAAAAEAEEQRASSVRGGEIHRIDRREMEQLRARQEAEAEEARGDQENQRLLAIEELNRQNKKKAQEARRTATAAKEKAEVDPQQQEDNQRKRRDEGPSLGRGNRRGELASQPPTPVRGREGEDPAILSLPGRQVAPAAPAVTAAAAVSTGSSGRDSAREEAWAAARIIAEDKARVQAFRGAALRAGDKHQDSAAARGGTGGGGGGGGGGAGGGGAATPTAALSGERGVAGDERDSSSSRPASIILDALVEGGGDADATRLSVDETELDVSGGGGGGGGGWRGFLSGWRQDGPGGGSATSSVSGSQVSAAVDPALLVLPEAGGGAPFSAATPSRPWGPHEFQRFFEAGEACAEPLRGEGGDRQGEGEEGVLTRPVGWRDPVNRAGVVQVGVLQAFDISSLKSGESVYVALRLLPWKERVKTGSAKWGDLGASWPSHTSARHDLLHLYNSDATPVPTLRIEVWRSAMRVLDDLLGYALINTAPLLARPGVTSERWHVLSNPNENSNDLAEPSATSSSLSPATSAGTILLSLGFTPTGAGTPSTRPVSATVPGSAGRSRRPFSADSPAASGNSSGGGFAGGEGGGGGGGGDSTRRTPRRDTHPPAIPEGFSLGTAAMSQGGGEGGGGGSSPIGRAEFPSAARHKGDARRPSAAFQRENNGDSGIGIDLSFGDSGTNGGLGGGRGTQSVLLPEVPESAGVDIDDSAGEERGAVEIGSTGQGQHEGKVEVEGGGGGEGEGEGGVDDEGGGGGEGEGGGEGMVHLFRVKSYPAPVWCEICDRLLLGMRNQGFCCEACGMNVHRGCQLRANFSKSCPGAKNKKSGAGGRHGSPPAKERNSREADEGVGLIQVHLRSAHRCGIRCHGGHHSYLATATATATVTHAEGGGFTGSGTCSAVALAAPATPSNTASNAEHTGFQGGGMFSPGRRRRGGGQDDSGFIRGDHYCRVRVGQKGGASGLAEEVRTEAVFQTPDPVFERTWVFVAPSYDACVTIDLVDASTDRPAGRFETTVMALLQADHDAHAVGRTPPSRDHRDIRLVPPGAEEDEDNVTGLLKARVEFDENTEAFFGPNGILGPGGGGVVRSIPPRQKADLSVETLKSLIARIKSVFQWVKIANDCYARVMSWENPALSSISLLAFVYLSLVANAEYLLALLPFSLLLFMTWGFLSRRSGGYVQAWVSTESAGLGLSRANNAGFRPVGTLKVAVVRGKGLVSSDLNLPGNAYVRVSYIVPDSNAEGAESLFIDNSGTGSGPQDPGTGIKEYLVGQTVPQPTGDNPEWGSVGGSGGGGGGGSGGGAGAGSSGGKAAGARASSVSMMDQSRGPGFLSGGSDALLQNMMDVWSRHAPSQNAEPPAAGSKLPGDLPEGRGAKQPGEHSAVAGLQEEDMCFVYPVLQPRVRRRGSSGSGGGLPWSGAESRTFLRFSVYFANPFNSLMDALQGHVVVPLSALASNETQGGAQPEVRGWFDVEPVEDNFPFPFMAPPPPPSPSHSALDGDSEAAGDSGSPRKPSQRQKRGRALRGRTSAAASSGGNKASFGDHRDISYDGGVGGGGNGSMGALFLRLQLILPGGGDTVVTDEDREASWALQALLGENSHLGEGDKGAGAGAASAGPAGGGTGGGGDGGGGGGGGAGREIDGGGGTVARLLGMPMGFRNTIREVQDTIGTVLDMVEAVKNLLNWTHPPKTLMVYALVALVWVVLLVVPGRYIVLTLGLLEFSKAWLGAKEPGAEEVVMDRSASTRPPLPLATKLKNLLMSLPVDSELAACYAWEAREYSKKAKASLKLREQRARLKLLGAGRQWEGALGVRDRVGDPWESRYVVLLGHRLAWWGSAKDLDDGRNARGQLLLQGHAGITHLSPVEAREVSDPRKVVCVFGRSPDGLPHKVTFISGSLAAKEALESLLARLETGCLVVEEVLRRTRAGDGPRAGPAELVQEEQDQAEAEQLLRRNIRSSLMRRIFPDHRGEPSEARLLEALARHGECGAGDSMDPSVATANVTKLVRMGSENTAEDRADAIIPLLETFFENRSAESVFREPDGSYKRGPARVITRSLVDGLKPAGFKDKVERELDILEGWKSDPDLVFEVVLSAATSWRTAASHPPGRQKRAAAPPAKGTPAARGGSQYKPATLQGAAVGGRAALPADGSAPAVGADPPVVPPDPRPPGGAAPAGGAPPASAVVPSWRAVAPGGTSDFVSQEVAIRAAARERLVDLSIPGAAKPAACPVKAVLDSGAGVSTIPPGIADKLQAIWGSLVLEPEPLAIMPGTDDVMIIGTPMMARLGIDVDDMADASARAAQEARVSGVETPNIAATRRVTLSVDALQPADAEEVPDEAVERLVARGPDMVMSPAQEEQGRKEALDAAVASAASAGLFAQRVRKLGGIVKRHWNAFRRALRGDPPADVEPMRVVRKPGTHTGWLLVHMVWIAVEKFSQKIDQARAAAAEEAAIAAASEQQVAPTAKARAAAVKKKAAEKKKAEEARLRQQAAERAERAAAATTTAALKAKREREAAAAAAAAAMRAKADMDAAAAAAAVAAKHAETERVAAAASAAAKAHETEGSTKAAIIAAAAVDGGHSWQATVEEQQRLLRQTQAKAGASVATIDPEYIEYQRRVVQQVAELQKSAEAGGRSDTARRFLWFYVPLMVAVPGSSSPRHHHHHDYHSFPCGS
eukprot:g5874.t1